MSKLIYTFEEMNEEIKRGVTPNMIEMMDPEIIGFDEETTSAVFRFKIHQWELNHRGQVHGGAVSGMFDTSMGFTVVAYSGRNVTTAELEISYLRPFNYDEYDFNCTVLHMGRKLARIEAKACSVKTGKLTATAHATFAFIE